MLGVPASSAGFQTHPQRWGASPTPPFRTEWEAELISSASIINDVRLGKSCHSGTYQEVFIRVRPGLDPRTPPTGLVPFALGSASTLPLDSL